MKEHFIVACNTGKEPFFYRGDIIEEVDDYIKINDKKSGIVRIYKHSIISIVKEGGRY